MLDWLPYRYQLSRLQRKKQKTVREQINAWEKARAKNKNTDELWEIMEAGRKNVEPFEEDIDYLISSYLSAQAQKLRLVMPESDNDWQWSKHRRHHLLTSAAMQALRSAIRAEKKESS